MKKIYSHILCLILLAAGGHCARLRKSGGRRNRGKKETERTGRTAGADKHETLPDSVLTDDYV